MNSTDSVITIGGLSLSLPLFFPSISTVKTNLTPVEYLKVIVALKYPCFLISAYDIFYSGNSKNKINKLLKTAQRQKQVVLLDSGNYESYWLKDKQWNETKFKKILKTSIYNLSFCYDEQNPPKSLALLTDLIENRVIGTQKGLENESIVPIIHAPFSILKDAVTKVAKRLQPLMLAIPERLLGDGILMRAITLFNIRKELSGLDKYIPIHLLGTGNPLSLLIYSMCGADSFDGLEWCQTAVDYKAARLLHFQQREFSEKQTAFDTLNDIPYTFKTLAHNLEFYINWMSDIQKKNVKLSLHLMMEQYLPEKFCKKLYKAIPQLKER